MREVDALRCFGVLPEDSRTTKRGLGVMQEVLSFVGGLATIVIVALVLILVIGMVIGPILMEFGWSTLTHPPGQNSPVMYFVISIAQLIIVCAVSGYAGYKVQSHLYPHSTESQMKNSAMLGFCWIFGATAIIFAFIIALGYLLADKG